MAISDPASTEKQHILSTPPPLVCPRSEIDAVYFLSRLHHKIFLLNLYTIICLFFIATNVTGLIVITQSKEDFEEDEYWMHVLEFWGAFIFSVIEISILRSSPSTMQHYKTLSVVTVTVITTFLSAVLVTFDREKYERAGHWIEYSSQFPLIALDLLLVSYLPVVPIIALIGTYLPYAMTIVAFFQLLVFGGVFGSDEFTNEQNSHYIEFTLAIINAIYAIIFVQYVVKNVKVQIEEAMEIWKNNERSLKEIRIDERYL